MQAYELKQAVGPEGLLLNRNRPVPEPGHGEILVKVHATSLNYRDLLVASGRYAGGSKPSLIPLSDGAGEVVAVGTGVTEFRVGERVAGTFFQGWLSGEICAAATARALGGAIDGMLADYVVLAETGAVSIPDHLGYEAAATLPCAALTAWNAVVEVGRVKAGDTVLLLGTGGVSVFALQFAKLQGAYVIVASKSEEKLARAKALGADLLINYRSTPEWDQAAVVATGGRGVDLVVEVGGGGTFGRSIRAVRIGGTIAVIGVVSGGGEIDPRPIIGKAIRLQGIYVGSRELFLTMNRAITRSALEPVIDREFCFDEAKEAFACQAAGSHFGKIVIRVGV